jgi:hypothetical protein
MTLTLQPVLVRTGGEEEGMLVFHNGRLVAVLVHLSDENEAAPGDWYLEVGFGPGLEGPDHPSFSSLDEAQDWIGERCRRRASVAR